MTQPPFSQPPYSSELPPPPTAPPNYSASPQPSRGAGPYALHGASPYGPPPHAGYTQKKKKRLSGLAIFLIVIVAIPALLFVGVAMIFGFYFLMMETAEETPLTEPEKAMLLTADEVFDYFDAGIEANPDWESADKMVFFDKSFDINYEYSDPDDDGIYISTTVNYEPKMSDARIGYNLGVTGSKSIVSLWGSEEITLSDVSEQFQWGDRSTLMFVLYDGEPVGHIFAAMNGKYTYDFFASGFAFETVEEFKQVMTPKLQAFDEFAQSQR